MAAIARHSSDPEHPDYQSLHDILEFPRGGQRGLQQKVAFIRQGVAENLLSPQSPFLTGTGLDTFNFLARSRVQVREEVLNRLRAEHKQRASREQNFEVTLPDSVSWYRYLSSEERFVLERPAGALRLTGIIDLSKVKLVFLDQHQVVDRSMEAVQITSAFFQQSL